MKRRFGKEGRIYPFAVICMLLLLHIQVLPQKRGAVFLQPRGTNIVVNGGFEREEKGIPTRWAIPQDIVSLDTNTVHSGRFSLKYARVDRGDYRLVSQKLPCVPGKFYKVTVWVKGVNVKGDPADQGAGFCIEWADKGGKWLGGSYPSCLAGTFDWREISTFVRIPKEAGEVHITLYMRRGTTGVAWFDDVEVIRVAPPLLTIRPVSPHYRGIIQLPTKGKKAAAKLEIAREDYDLRDVNLWVMSELRDGGGALVAGVEKELKSNEEESEIAFPLPELSPGSYEWIFRLLKGKEELARESIDLRAVKKVEEKVYIDEKGRLIVNGKPFFPLGLYLGPTEEEHLKRIGEAGFNTILCYGYGVEREPEAYMERAQKYGLKVIYSIKDFYEGTSYFPQMGKSGLELAKEYVEKFRDHPALLAWYINDELPISYIPRLTEMYELVKKLDPNHPQLQVLYQIPDLELYYNCTDIMGVDPYPIPSQPITMVSEWTSLAVKAMAKAKPVWVVPQIFDWSVYSPNNPPREPTFEEKKNMFYQALINGAKGLIAYSYFDLLRITGGKEAPREIFERRWQEISRIAKEIKSLIPALLGGEDVAQLQGKLGDGKVMIRGLSYRNKLYILSANTSSESLSITLLLPGKGWKTAKSIDGTPITLKEGKLSLQLKPLESTTYVISK